MPAGIAEPDPIFYKNSDFTNYTMRISGNLLCPTDETFGRRCPVPAIGLFDNALPFPDILRYGPAPVGPPGIEARFYGPVFE